MIAKLTLRNLAANKGRFALTTFGVVLAVSFVVSAFVLGDGLRRTFGDLSDEIVAGTDIEVRTADTFGAPTTLTAADLAIVLDTPGVDAAVGVVEAPENSVRPLKADGSEIPTAGPPQLAFNWSSDERLSPFALIEGDAPEVGEFVVDLGSADRHGFEIGETYDVITATGRHELTLSGLTRFGSDNQTLGAVLMSMNTAEVSQLFGTDGFDNIAIAVDDSARADVDAVIDRLAAALPAAEVVDQGTVADETASEFNTQVDIVQNILLGFAGVSLFVSIFIIYNTFAIVLSQRTREMALLRLVGADSTQLRRAAMGEALAIGIIASVLGIAGGLGVAAALTALFAAIGADLPDYPTIISARTIIAASVVGLGVTLVAAWGPTRSASRVPAIAALRDGLIASQPRRAVRIVVGAALALVGIGAGALGLAGAGGTAATISAMALAAVLVFVGVTLVSPVLVQPVVRVLRLGLDRLGISGRLAADNAGRNPNRTATTAAALMIGLAVVSMALVVGESIKAQLGKTLETAVTADYLLTDQTSEAGFPTELASLIEADASFDDVTGFRYSEVMVAGEVGDVTAANFGAMPALIDIDVTAGGYPSDEAIDSVIVSADRAETDGLVVGDSVETTFESGDTRTLTVAAIFDDSTIIESDWLVDITTLESAGVVESDLWLAFSTADTASESDVVASLALLEDLYPQGELDTAGEFRERLEGLIDQMLSVLNALVALAVIIALIGIANTLALSVHERTREIGLVRAVGMSRRQTRRMIRYESAIIAGFGALLGSLIGIGFGWAMVEALPASFTDTLAVPGTRIVTLLVVATLAGLVAAWLPARRAGRMNVLDAIAT